MLLLMRALTSFRHQNRSLDRNAVALVSAKSFLDATTSNRVSFRVSNKANKSNKIIARPLTSRAISIPTSNAHFMAKLGVKLESRKTQICHLIFDVAHINVCAKRS